MPPKQKRRSHLENPPPAESDVDQEHTHEEEEDDEEEEEEEVAASSDEQEEEEEEDDEDDDEEKYRLSRAAPKNPTPNPKSLPSSDSESATESDSEPDPPAPTPNSKAKPQASKPKEQAPKVKAQTQAQASPSRSTPTAMQAKSGSKRPAENNGHSNDPKQGKKKKVADDAPDSDLEHTKKVIRRVFSDQDEVTILEGMIEFRSTTGGSDPFKCGEAFHDFMKKRSKGVSFDASVNQLKEKMRKMKLKYQNNSRRGKNGFSKPHEKKAFDLAQVFWSGEEGGTSNNGAVEKAAKPVVDGKAVKGTPNPKKDTVSENAEKPKPKPNSEVQLPLADSKEFEKVDVRPETSVALGSMIKHDKGLDEFALGEDFLRKGNELMEASKRAEFEAKWKKLEDAELDLRVKRAELYANQAKLMLQAIKSSKK